MKVLMFGWEFPPHISGGLGTACYGLAKALAAMDVRVTLVIPKAKGDEDQSSVAVVGANQVSVVLKNQKETSPDLPAEIVAIESPLIPYTTPEEYLKFSEQSSLSPRLVPVDNQGQIQFTGDYGNNLFQEVEHFAKIAGILAGEYEFDVIYAHDWMTFPAGMAAKQASGKPLVVHVHSTEFDRGAGWANPRIFEVEKMGLEAAGKIIAVSQLTRKIIHEKYQIPTGKVVTVYNAVEQGQTVRKRPSAKKGPEKVVSFLGRITVQKGPGYFAEAAGLVLKTMKNVRFVMAGKGDLAELMMRRVNELGIADRFQFPGFLDKAGISALFGKSDVFVMPSVSEPFGIVALEAMLAGVPVVVSKQSGVSEVITNVLKVNYWDVEALAGAICTLLSDASLGLKISSDGKREAKKFQWNDSAKAVQKVLADVINQPL